MDTQAIRDYLTDLQNWIVGKLEAEDGLTFRRDEWKRPDGAKPILAASAIGSGTWMFGTYLFERVGAGKKVNWVGGGGPATILGGLQTKQFDGVMCAPSVKFAAEDKGWGHAIFDVSDDAAITTNQKHQVRQKIDQRVGGHARRIVRNSRRPNLDASRGSGARPGALSARLTVCPRPSWSRTARSCRHTSW